jgi:LPS-assembly protein
LRQEFRPLCLLLVVSTLAAGAARGEEADWSYCREPARPVPLEPIDYRGLPADFTADWARFIAEQQAVLEGDVRFTQGERSLRADRMTYSQAEQLLEARGAIEYQDPVFTITGTQAILETDTELGEFAQAEYRIWPVHGRGRAESIARTAPGLVELNQATYTTCDPGSNDWLFKVKRLLLNQDEGLATASGTTLRLGGVPVLYLPRITFPIDDRRRSGWLLPSAGSSNASGFQLGVPYYWNIAPNYDATLTPNIFSDRGFRLDSEFRYLTRSSNGKLDLQWMPDDRKRDESRYAGRIEHRTRLARSWSADILASDVSDDEYLDDFGNSLSLASITHLERRGDLRYASGPWAFLTRVQDFQTIDPEITAADRPYQRLPQLLLTGRGVPLGGDLYLDLRTELAQFDQDARVTGQRGDLYPALRWSPRGSYWFFEPRLGYRLTAYDLDDTAAGAEDQPDREIPVASVDGGLFFERSTAAGRIQTLEPRIFLAYIPFRDQDDLPLFDTSEQTFTRGSLFRADRFTGPDRVGDTQQATLALTSRLYDPRRGTEQLSATLGQIHYFEDRRVTLTPGEAPQTRSRSDLVAQVEGRFADRWRAGAELFWDPDRELYDRITFDIGYRRDARHLANVSYRYLRDSVEHVDASGYWPLGGRWRGIGRWLYSLRDERSQEALLGVEYETCCWRMQIIAREYITSEFDSNQGLYFQLWLKGLTGLGNRPGDLLERGILGYQD